MIDRDYIIQQIADGPFTESNLFWEAFYALWPPRKWDELLAQLEAEIKALPHGNKVWPHLEPYIGEAINVGYHDGTIGPNDDGMWSFPRAARRISDFIDKHDNYYYEVWRDWIASVYETCNEELHTEYQEDLEAFNAAVETGWRKYSEDHYPA